MCCNGSANWKREKVPDHKFDFVDTRDYHSRSWVTRFQYLWFYILIAKSFLVYLSDIFTAITMLSTDKWSNSIYDRCDATMAKAGDCVIIDFNVGKWIFVGCIIFGYLLVVYEAWKAKKIIISRDISYAFTNVMAHSYYCLRSYDHFCFFAQIENSTKKKDDFAFFIFFTFKGWKRLVLADGPRQSINALTLYSFWRVNGGGLPDISVYFDGTTLVTKVFLVSIFFTVIVFLGSLLLLIIAALCYIPLLCYIQGNLKEYCCHKVDKRISELMKRKNRARIAKQAQLAQKEAAGDYSHLKNKKGELLRNPAPQPTLPNVSIDDDEHVIVRPRTGKPASSYAPSYATHDYHGAGSQSGGYKTDYYPEYPPSLHGGAPEYPPPMPLYDQQNPPYLGTGYPTAYGGPGGPGPHPGYDESLYDNQTPRGSLRPDQMPGASIVGSLPNPHSASFAPPQQPQYQQQQQQQQQQHHLDPNAGGHVDAAGRASVYSTVGLAYDDDPEDAASQGRRRSTPVPVYTSEGYQRDPNRRGSKGQDEYGGGSGHGHAI